MNVTFNALAVYSFCLSAICLIKRRKRLKARNRRWWVRPINEVASRRTLGLYETLFETLRLTDHEEFFEFTRMWPEKFAELLSLVEPFMVKKSNRPPLQTALCLAFTLAFLAHGNSIRFQTWAFRIGRSTGYKLIPAVCKAIWDALQPICLPAMNQERFSEVANGFMNMCQFPNCLGAVDGKHVKIRAPPRSGSEFFNYKDFFSIVLMASCDARYRFTWVDVGQYGSISDGGVWSRSEFGTALDRGHIDLPGPKPLPDSDIITNHVFLADEAFPLKTFMLRPYPRKELGDAERVFNYRLSRARRTIENSFGILGSRWRIYHKTLCGSPETVEKLVLATICLHNFLMLDPQRYRYCPRSYIDQNDTPNGEWRRDEANLRWAAVNRLGANNATRTAEVQRDVLRDYFVSTVGEAQAPWQYGYAFRGLAVNVPQD